MKRILMASTLYWTSPVQVGAHHLARSFVSKGYDVAFISDPISLFRFMKRPTHDSRARRKLYWRSGQRYLDGKLWTYVPGALLTPANARLRRSKWLHRHWWRFSVPNVTCVAKRNGFEEVDLLYLDNPRQHFWLRTIRARRTVYRMADYNLGFRRSSPAIAELEKKICQTVDTVAYTAMHLREHVESLNPKTAVYFPNGVDLQHFQHAFPKPVEYDSLTSRIAVYVGSLDFWFDFELIARLARELPDVHVMLIGPDARVPQFVRSAPNVHVLGARSYSKLPAYLQHANVGLIPFRTSGSSAELVRCINPLKLYEYLACGLPVVAMEWDELQLLKTPARLANSQTDFIRQTREALASKSKAEIGMDGIKEIDWARRSDELLNVA